MEASELFSGPGEMRARCRALDWAATPLGPVAAWPSSLCTAADVTLAAPTGMVLLWGPELVMLYNDAYVPVMGDKHPWGLGRPNREVWPEVWDFTGPIYDGVLRRGESFTFTDQPLVLERPGLPPEGWFTLTYSPVHDESGDVAGILVAVFETTAQVRAGAEREAALRASEAKYRALFDSLDAGFCIIEVLYDDAGRPDDYRFVETNPAFVRQSGLADAVGRTVRSLVPSHEAHWFETYGRVARTGEPARFDAPAEALGRWFDVYAFRVGAPEQRRVAVLFNDVSAAKAAARERERLFVELQAAQRRSDFLATLGTALQPLADPDAVMATAARLLGEHLAVDRCAYAEVWGDEDTFTITGDYTRGDTRSIVGEYRFRAFGAECLRLMRADEAYVVDDSAADPRVTPDDLPAYEATQIRAVICVPLHKAGRFVAAMAVHQRAPRRWTPDEVDLAVTVVRRCWESLERARAYRNLRAREAVLRATSAQLVERTAAAEAAQETAEAAQQAAEAANRAKSEFLAVMSHELRTPLNAIGGYAELLDLGIHGPVTGAQRQALERIQQSQRHLLGLINQVLNYTRVDAGVVRYELADVAATDALREAEALVLPQVQARGLAYAHGPCEPSLAVRADREKLQQILLNLLTNAIKFTEPGGEVRVACESRGDRVAFAVIDTGIGIAPEKMPTIFDPFVQVDQRHTRPHEGVGLGLAISRDLARGMGGDLTAASAPGQGSVFTLEVPRAHGRSTA